jgi:hypothetical protein
MPEETNEIEFDRTVCINYLIEVGHDISDLAYLDDEQLAELYNNEPDEDGNEVIEDEAIEAIETDDETEDEDDDETGD